MALTKIDMLKAIKTIVENSDTANKQDYLKTLDTTIESIENKYANAKLKKQAKLNTEYAELENKTLELLQEKGVIVNADITFVDSTSKKTQVLTRLQKKGLVERIAPHKECKVVSYKYIGE